MIDGLTEQEAQRYARHLIMPEVGVEGQRRLREASVLVVGAGGLGSPAAYYLAAAGVGRLGLIDADVVEMSNLQRQILHATSRLGAPKVDSAARMLADLNPGVGVETVYGRLTEENAPELLGRYDFVVDAVDNFATKFLISDVCSRIGVPYSYGGVDGMRGMTMTWTPGCATLRDLFGSPDELPKRPPVGVVGAVTGIIGSIQAAEAIKYIVGAGGLLTDVLLTVDVLSMTFTRHPLR